MNQADNGKEEKRHNRRNRTNKSIIRIFGVKENYKYLEILEATP